MIYREFSISHQGVKQVDFYLAKQLCDLLGRTGDNLLFYTILACSESVREGHSCLKLSEWQNQRCWQIAGRSERESDQYDISDSSVDLTGFEFPCEARWDEQLSTLQLSSSQEHPVVYEGGRFYLRRFWLFENEMVGYIRHFSQAILFNQVKAIDTLDTLFPSKQEADWQKISVSNALGKKLSVITGGPGTGKTTTVTKLLLALCEVYDNDFSIKLVAPTGKAAQRLTESIQKAKVDLLTIKNVPDHHLESIPNEATTIHRLLGAIPSSNEFRFNNNRRLSLDILLIDEVSMVDLGLMARLFRALPDNARVIMLGDPNQLPSVATGSVLADIAPSPHPGYSAPNIALIKQLTGWVVPSTAGCPADYLTSLQKSYRFKQDGGIGKVASKVIAGKTSESWQLLSEGDNEVSLASESEFSQWILDLETRFYRNIAVQSSVSDAIHIFSQFRILAATRAGDRGVESINRDIDNRIRRSLGVSINATFYHGCPLLITENNYENELFNGDIGMVWLHEGRLQACFYSAAGQLRWVSLQRLPKYELVYAMTIHKTQGSEFKHVAIALPTYDSRILSRELVYTGITRARDKLEVFSNESIWRNAVTKKVSRNSGLYDKLFVNGTKSTAPVND